MTMTILGAIFAPSKLKTPAKAPKPLDSTPATEDVSIVPTSQNDDTPTVY